MAGFVSYVIILFLSPYSYYYYSQKSSQFTKLINYPTKNIYQKKSNFEHLPRYVHSST